MSKILGITFLDQKPAATLIHDSEIIASVEEERFTRVKNSPGDFPHNSIVYCLQELNLRMRDISCITVGWHSPSYLKNVPNHFCRTWSEYGDIKNANNLLWESNLIKKYKPYEYLNEIKDNLAVFGYIPKIKFHKHHYSHALSSFCCSGFDESIVITIDGHGEKNCTVIWHANRIKLTKLHEINIPHSMGWFYSAFTKYLGFAPYYGEGQLMALAAYGKYNKDCFNSVSKLFASSETYKLDPSYFCYGMQSTKEFTLKFEDLFNNFNQEDVAFACQKKLEDIMRLLVRWAVKKTGVKNLCLAGGVCLNCKSNGELINEVDVLFVQPMSGDDGTSLGSALAELSAINKRIPHVFLEHVYLGCSYSTQDYKNALNNLNYSSPDNLEFMVANEIAKGKVVAWFQGKMEAGPRALGNRSILGDPRHMIIKDKINKIKKRQLWRPLCPSIPYEYKNHYFDLKPGQDSPFMVIAFTPNNFSQLLGATHVDGTCRPQFIRQKHNPRFHKLLLEFGKITGHPVLLNTSFNIESPIVCSPSDAIHAFLNSDIDILVIGEFFCDKTQNNSSCV